MSFASEAGFEFVSMFGGWLGLASTTAVLVHALALRFSRAEQSAVKLVTSSSRGEVQLTIEDWRWSGAETFNCNCNSISNSTVTDQSTSVFVC